LADIGQGRHGVPAVGSVKIAAGVTPGHPHDLSRVAVTGAVRLLMLMSQPKGLRGTLIPRGLDTFHKSPPDKLGLYDVLGSQVALYPRAVRPRLSGGTGACLGELRCASGYFLVMLSRRGGCGLSTNRERHAT
jgi:hypothetical protein